MSQTTWSKLPAFVSNVSPALSTHNNKLLVMVAVAPDGSVRYSTTQTCNAGWIAWKIINPQSGHTILKAEPNTPAVLVSTLGETFLFCRGADNNLYKTERTADNDWMPWQQLTSDGAVRGRISVAFSAAAGVQHAHVVYAASNSTVRYQRFAVDWSPAGPPEEWSDAREGVIASDGSYELLVVIRKSSGQMLTQRTIRPWGGAWQSISALPLHCLDISNLVFFAGAFHVAYVMKTPSDSVSGTYVCFLAHTRFRAGMDHDGYFRVLLEYQPQNNTHTQATLNVYRNKLVAAYTDDQSFVRYAYWDTADPKTPWIGMEVVASGKSRNRPALSWANLDLHDKKQANYGNDLFAAVRGMTAGSLWTINFSRAFFAHRFKELGLAVKWCTQYPGPTLDHCLPYANAPQITEVPAFSEVGFGTMALPDWLMSVIFKRVMQYVGDPSASYYTWILTDPQWGGAGLGPNITMAYAGDYLLWDHELGHRFATNIALWNDGEVGDNPNLMSDLFPDSIVQGATEIFGKWTNTPMTCKGGSDGARCRGFTGDSANYDVMDRQHSLIMPLLLYMRDSDRLRQLAHDDLRQGIDLLRGKYAWIRKYIFGGVEFKKDNEPLPVVTIMNKHSGKALDVASWNMNDRADIQQYTFHGGDNQRWALLPDSDGYFQFIAMHSGKCLDVPGSSQQNGAKIQLYTCHGGNNQKWKLTPDGDGHYEIVARHSGKCLDVTSWGTTDGVSIQQYERHRGANQKWKIEFAATF